MLTEETTCTLLFRNESTKEGAVCVFQTDASLGVPEAQPVAWLVKSAAPKTSVLFQWLTRYCFVWAQTCHLSPGVVVRSSQVWPSTPRARNEVVFRREQQTYTFAPAEREGTEGTLSIITDATVERDQAVIGIGMAELPTFLVPARPDQVVTFQPQPSYWITFGQFAPGQIVEQEARAAAVALPFSPTVDAVAAVLRPDQSWLVTLA